MSARLIVEETMPGLDPEAQERIANAVTAFLSHEPMLPSGALIVRSPAEAVFAAHVAQGTCTTQIESAGPGQIRVVFTRVRKHHADPSEWATKPDDPNATPSPLVHRRPVPRAA